MVKKHGFRQERSNALASNYRIWDNIDKKWIDCPSAKPVKIEGYESFEFFSHHPYLGNEKWGKTFRLSEKTSGGSVSQSEKRSSLVENFLAKKATPELLQSKIDKAIEKERYL